MTSTAAWAGGDGGGLAPLAGDYYSEELDAPHHVRLVDGRLLLGVRDLPPQPLAPTGADTFRARGMVLHFERGAGGTVTGYTVDAGRVRGIRFVRR